MKPRTRSRGSGQGLVEFALVLPVFLLILFGLIDVGRYVYLNSVLSQAAREAARVGAAEAGWIGKTTTDDPACVTSSALVTAANPGAHVCPAAVSGASNSLQAEVTAAANRMVAPFGSVKDVYFSCQPTGSAPAANWTNTDCVAANRAPSKSVVWVRVDQTFTPMTPVIGQIIGTLTTTASSTMVIN